MTTSNDSDRIVVAQNDDNDDDDMPRLSAETLAALQEFYAENNLSETEHSTTTQTMPKEDWQLSQFWYDDQTSQSLAEEVLAVVKQDGRIACISCPSVYKKLREIACDSIGIYCLEFDRRFSSFGRDYVFYDYNEPLNLPEGFEKAFDLVVADPPFLSEECLGKTVQTINHLAKDKVILCTGAVMENLAKELLDATPCQFRPRHSNGLANEFRCFVNYKPVTLF